MSGLSYGMIIILAKGVALIRRIRVLECRALGQTQLNSPCVARALEKSAGPTLKAFRTAVRLGSSASNTRSSPSPMRRDLSIVGSDVTMEAAESKTGSTGSTLGNL